MKIGILTFHMAHNFGAMLQAYALCQVLQSFSDCECQIIDYRLPEIYEKYERLLEDVNVEPKRLRFNTFMKERLPLSNRITNIYQTNVYDIYVLGSDQIWNPEITKGYKDVYFGLSFPNNCISYAASTGIENVDWKLIADKVKKIQFIGLREKWCLQSLHPYLNKKLTYCLDPVLLIDSLEWNIFHKKAIQKPFGLIYAFDVFDDEYEVIEEQALKYNQRLIEIVTHVRYRRAAIKYDIDCGPEEFVNYIKEAQMMYTDSYHGVLFSIIFQKPFMYLSRGEAKDARVYDILSSLEIRKTNEGFYTIQPHSLRLLEKYRDKSLSFLRNAIDEVKKNAKF